MRHLILVLALLLPGCATLEKLSTPEVFTACTVADTATTLYAVHTGLAREVNPLLTGSVNAHRFLPLIAAKLAVIGLIWYVYNHYQASKEVKVVTGGAALVTCGVAALNARVIAVGLH